MIKVLRRRGISLYLLLAAAVLALAAGIVAAVSGGLINSQEYAYVPILVCSVAAFILIAADMFFAVDFLPILVVGAFAGALGASLYYGLPVVMDQINGVVVYGGKFGNVMFYLLAYFVCVAVGIFVCFFEKNRAGK